MELATEGNCACWGSAGNGRSSLVLSEGIPRLYEMDPHNVSNETESLSLVLGIGVLAHAAANYEGREDVFANAVWEQPRAD